MFSRIQKSPVLGFDVVDQPSQHGDRVFVITLMLLCATGLVMVYSASFYKAFMTFRDPFHFLKDHSIRLGIGILLFSLAYLWDYHHLRRWSLWILIGSLLSLIWVLLFTPRPHRWLTLLGITVQPSEFARVALVIYLADWCSRHSHRLQKSWGTYLFAVLIVALPVALVLIEPSFSAASMLALTGGTLLFLAGAKIRHLIFTILPAIPVGIIAAIMEPYRLNRIYAFFHPLADPQGAGYQSNMSLVAVGSGQIMGVGMGMSGQKNHFLPEAHCDFIFSILCEEKGFLGAMIVLAVFFLFAWRGIKIALRSPDQFGFLLAGGLVFSMIFFILMNIAVALALVPVTGLPLPFVSYGGSALIANLIACGIILNISRHAQSPEAI